ncbi:MAG: hypothetical protein A3K19_04345 [Lentisphaerae bacterium RIFOXYB12_FULL_65_16]|nr:MAG: hypothetical protein A3K18_34815 [Lentisphaerae bacterium RIFOXYA12_64_32]OGV84551.1 MAG: hypothetical protein A3K19_04345 [Lentisphaerae bacterium RIFOXYB12_FULL_65_16]
MDRTSMTGLERTRRCLAGGPVDRLPVLPILHSGLAPLAGVPLGRFLTDADAMAGVLLDGYRRFGYDGIQFSLGVTAEAEALGARVTQPEDGAPILTEHLVADWANLPRLAEREPERAGRFPLFADAIARVMDAVGAEAFILPTLRGPLLMASQLRGVEPLLMDMLDTPEQIDRLLSFTTDVALRLGRWLRRTGAHGLVLGEATCSPSFISPTLYRELVLPHHRRLIADLKAAGWETVGLHICGATLPIVDDVISTGADFMDVDYQVPAEDILARTANRMALRGNLDPSSVLRFGKPADVRQRTVALLAQVRSSRWIVSSGCDIPPGTPAANIAALVEACRG